MADESMPLRFHSGRAHGVSRFVNVDPSENHGH